MAKEEDQIALFDSDPEWEEHWKGMPEFVQEDLEPIKQITVSFETPEDMQKFAEIVWKFKRWHHEVNYSIFKINRLRKKAGLDIPEVRDNYGMRLYEFKDSDEAAEWTIQRTEARLSRKNTEPDDVIDFDLLTGRTPKGLVVE